MNTGHDATAPRRGFLSGVAALGASALLRGSQYLYGTDYPFRDGAEVNGGLSDYGGFSAAELTAINRDNALRLFPQLKR